MTKETPAQRLRLALEMHDFGVRMQRARLHRVHPEASDAEIEADVQEWLLSRPGAPLGDAPGSPSRRFA